MNQINNETYLLRPPGIPVIVNDFICIGHERKQYRFPKTKKK